MVEQLAPASSTGRSYSEVFWLTDGRTDITPCEDGESMLHFAALRETQMRPSILRAKSVPYMSFTVPFWSAKKAVPAHPADVR